MKKFRYQRRQKKKVRVYRRDTRLVLYRFGPTWNSCRIIYQDPDFYHKQRGSDASNYFRYSKVKNTSIHYVGSATCPQFVYDRSHTWIYLMGDSCHNQFGNYYDDDIDCFIFDFWETLDYWAREYNWPSTKHEILPLKDLTRGLPVVDNLATPEPSEHRLRHAKYLIFHSPQ